MSKINIVSALMDKVPPKYKEGYDPSKDKIAVLILAYKTAGQVVDSIRNAVRNSSSYYNEPEWVQEEYVSKILDAVMAVNMPSGPMWLLKMKVRKTAGGGYETVLHKLVEKAAAYVVVDAGQRKPVQRSGHGTYEPELGLMVNQYNEQLKTVVSGMDLTSEEPSEGNGIWIRH